MSAAASSHEGSVLEFTRRVLEHEGALVADSRTGTLETVLPKTLRSALELDEFALLGTAAGADTPCGYGSETLRRLASCAVGSGRVSAYRVENPPCAVKPVSGLTGLNLTFRVLDTRPASGWTLAAAASYKAAADDERLGLAEAAVSAPEGVPLPPPELEELTLTALAPSELAREPLTQAFPSLVAALQAQAARELDDFRKTVARRYLRDTERVERYFANLETDLRRRLGIRRGGPLEAKLRSVPAELERRRAQLDSIFHLRLRLSMVSLVAIVAPVLVAELEVRRRKHRRKLEVRYDWMSRRWVGLGCDGCGANACAFAMCDDAEHVLCTECWDRCGTGGHRSCFRCAGQPKRRSWEEVEFTRAAQKNTARQTGQMASEDTLLSTRPGTSLPEKAERGDHDRQPAMGIATRSATPEPRRPEPSRADSANRQEEDLLASRVLDLLRRYRVPLSSEEIRWEIPMDSPKLRRLLASLVDRGLVGRTGRSRGTRYFAAGNW